jgi:hypothetical protein
MKRLHKIIPTLVALLGLALPGYAVVLLDDTWADGTRTNQNLPAQSAWYASGGSSLTAASKSMTLSLSVGKGAVLAITYFTTNAASPVQLGVGDTLLATISLAFSGMAAANDSMGFKLGLVDFADSGLSPKRVSEDLDSNNGQGNGVQGYALFQNMGTTFGKLPLPPMSIRKRTDVQHWSLLGGSGAWTLLTAGPVDTSAFSGFANNTPYTLQLTLQRTSTNSLSISAAWLNTASGATLSTSATDTNATSFNFDGIALRPMSSSVVASKITFNGVKVEVVRAAKSSPTKTLLPAKASSSTNALPAPKTQP